MSHTPGPWKIEHFNAPIADTGDYDCVTRVAGPEKETIVDFFNGNEADEANAKLIAAAPIMYDYIGLLASSGDLRAKQILESINAGR